MSALEEFPQWIDDVEDPDLGLPCPVDADEVEIREWIDSKLRRIARLHRDRRIQQQIVSNERARIKAFEDREVGQLDRAIEFHEADIRAWMEKRLAEEPGVKSYRLPAGTVSSRKLADKVEIDPQVVPELLVKRPDLARKVERFELDKAALNEAVAAGEEFDGVTVERDRVSIKVSIDGFGESL